MKETFQSLYSFLSQIVTNSLKSQSEEYQEITILGSWQLIHYNNEQCEKIKLRQEEIWSFAAMDEAETNGVYVCDLENWDSIVGKWEITLNSRLQLLCDDNCIEYCIGQLSNDTLVLKACNIAESKGDMAELFFKRIA